MLLRLAVVVLPLLALVACTRGGASDASVHVVAAFYPLEFAAQRVGGDAVAVESLTPKGVEPHDLELTSSQVRDLAGADLVVYLGSGFQPAVEDALAGLDRDRQLDALKGQHLVNGAGTGDATVDPHVWLDPTRMRAIVDAIAARLEDVDPGDAARFRRNAAALDDQLADLDDDYRRGLADCRSDEIVTSHAAFGYLAARYHLTQVSVSGIDPEAEPSPQRLADVAALVRRDHVSTIFFEEIAPSDLAETLARETGARTQVLSPLETPPDHGDYLTVMRTNLSRLEGALDCA